MMKNTTLCYIQDGSRYLMLHRIKKKQDLNQGKWIGIGGKFEEGESPDDCLLREVREETGFTLTDYTLRGIVTFVSKIWETEQMFLYTARGFTGQLQECEEGVLAWKEISQIQQLPLWEGDRIFLDLLQKDAPFFCLKLCYDEKDCLTEAVLDGKKLL